MTRKAKWVTAIAVLVIVAIAGTAVAMFITRAEIKGGINGQSLAISWKSALTVESQESMVCQTAWESGAMKLDITNAMPGGSCVIAGEVWGQSTAAKATKVKINGLPTGVTAELLPASCGATINLTPVTVRFRVSFDAAAPALQGSNNPFAAGSGLEAVLATDFTPALCETP